MRTEMPNHNRALLERTLRSVEPADARVRALAAARQARLTKPRGSLGRLEEIAERAAAARCTLEPRADDRAVFVFAADHGITAEGVSAYPAHVTAQMVANFAAGGGAINAIARAVGADLWVVDVGVAADLAPSPRVLARKVAKGSRNFLGERAMRDDETLAALAVGIETLAEAAARGVEIVALGEMGIGNTTTAAAVTAALTGRPAREVVGRGTGADDEMLAHKISVVERALALHAPDPRSPLEVLGCVGGLEIAAICGACLGAAANRVLVVVDGLIAPGHAALLDCLGLRPLLDLEIRLGEASGAALALPVVAAALATFREMATFESAGVSDRE
jgi:nicotinate-nucleotide--dimethylbenzimidazole phosphoribosyltransferase